MKVVTETRGGYVIRGRVDRSGVLAKAGPEMLVVINTTPSALQTQQNDQSPH